MKYCFFQYFAFAVTKTPVAVNGGGGGGGLSVLATVIISGRFCKRGDAGVPDDDELVVVSNGPSNGGGGGTRGSVEVLFACAYDGSGGSLVVLCRKFSELVPARVGRQIPDLVNLGCTDSVPDGGLLNVTGGGMRSLMEFFLTEEPLLTKGDMRFDETLIGDFEKDDAMLDSMSCPVMFDMRFVSITCRLD